MSVLALLLAAAAFACLAMAMERHHRDVAGHAPSPAPRRRPLQVLGVVGLAASLMASIAAWGVAQGFVGWCGVLAAGAGAMVLWLSFRSPAKPAPRPSSRS